MLAQIVWFGFRIGEVNCPTKYLPEASSINLRRSMVYELWRQEDFNPLSSAVLESVPSGTVL
jgi:hypothetical protein